MMIVALSRFQVENGREDALREALLNRPGSVREEPGFLGLEVLTDTEDPSWFYLITRWTDVDSFRQWHSGPAHKAAPQGILKGLQLDVRSDETRDSGSPMSEFLQRSTSVYWLKVRSDGLLLAYNQAIQKRFDREFLDGGLIWPLLTGPDAANLRHAVDGGRREPAGGYRFNFVDRDRMPFTLQCQIDVQPAWFVLIGEPVHEDEMRLQRELMTLNSQLAVQLRENDRQAKALRRTKAELEQALSDLVKSQRHLTNLQEVIPICMICGKVKTAEAKWEDVLAYFERNTLSLSHGYCPACVEKELDKLNQ